MNFNRPGTAQVKECVASETAQNGEAKAISPGNARSVSIATERVRMGLREFAGQRSLQVKRSREDDTDNIVRKYGEIYEYGDGALGVMLMSDRPRRGIWVRSRGNFKAVGMTIPQNCDQEGAAVFNGNRDPGRVSSAADPEV